jgi:hypothetical protein
MLMPAFIQLIEVHSMTQQIDKSKLRDLINRTPVKDMQYLHINPMESRSLQDALKELERFVGKGGAEVVAVRN